MEKSPVLAIVVPCYKEEAVLHETHKRLSLLLDKLIAERHISQHSYILYVNDGSTDQTWPIIKDLHQNTPYACGLNLAGNVGHQNALMAGLNAVKERCDVAISIDADLQDDVNAIPEMLERYREGCDIVYGVRRERKTDTFFKRTTALTFYKLMKIMGVKSVYNHADYRLMSKKALDALSKFHETNLFLRGLIPTMGFQSDIVYFDVKEREAGQSKYTLKKMMTLAVDGITSMSTRPLQMIVILGFLTFLFSIGLFISCIVDWANGAVVAGWTTTVASTCLIGGITLLSQGIIGEYIGKIYMESKGRPRYIVDSMILRDAEDSAEEEQENERKD